MMTEYDELVKNYWRLSHGNYIVKKIDDAGLEDEVKKNKYHAVTFGRFCINFIHAINGFYTNDLCYEDTDSMYNENNHWDKLHKAGLVGKNLLQGKNNCKGGGFFYGLFLAPKTKFCVNIKERYGNFDDHKTFKGFTNVSDNLDRKVYLKMFNGNKLIAKVPLNWKKSFSMGVVIPHKIRICNKCMKDILCDGCDKIKNRNKDFSANLNELK